MFLFNRHLVFIFTFSGKMKRWTHSQPSKVTKPHNMRLIQGELFIDFYFWQVATPVIPYLKPHNVRLIQCELFIDFFLWQVATPVIILWSLPAAKLLFFEESKALRCAETPIGCPILFRIIQSTAHESKIASRNPAHMSTLKAMPTLLANNSQNFSSSRWLCD